MSATSRVAFDNVRPLASSPRRRLRGVEGGLRRTARRSARGQGDGHRLTRSVQDPNEVEVVMEFASRADAEAYRGYMEQPSTQEALARAGVVEHAPMWIGDQVETVSY